MQNLEHDTSSVSTPADAINSVQNPSETGEVSNENIDGRTRQKKDHKENNPLEVCHLCKCFLLRMASCTSIPEVLKNNFLIYINFL